MTYLVVAEEAIICTCNNDSDARVIAAALSRCDSESTAFSVYSQSSGHIEPAICEVTFRNGKKEERSS